MKPLNKFQLIAPCGMNCSICVAYLREKTNVPVVGEMTLINLLLVLNAKLKPAKFFKKASQDSVLNVISSPAVI